MVDFYLQTIRISIIEQFQYRAANYFYMIGMVAEPVIYLVVWSTIATAQGGQVGGYTAGGFAAYFIVWTFVRNMNIVFTPYGWEWRIRQGRLSSLLLRPIHPLHYDIAFFAGSKFVWSILWIPIGVFLVLIFRPTFQTSLLEIGVFLIAIWGAYLIRTMLLWVLGMISFWTTRVSALYSLYWALELLLSGRLVPMTLLPPWARQIAAFLPFQWTFGYPIDALIGQLTATELLFGLGMQLFWIAAGTLMVQVVWRVGIGRYTAVGG